jgi:hypothetical protein
VFLRRIDRSTAKAIEPVALRVTPAETGCTPMSGTPHDDLDDRCRTRFLVNHKRRGRARDGDGDGDGERAVPSNRIDGLRLGLRYDLLPCRGVSKRCLDSHLAFDPGTHNDRRDLRGLLRQLSRPITPEGT